VAGKQDDDYQPPREPGWYPDPWSATGTGERYFDGKKWGTSERPLARHTAVDIDLGRGTSKRGAGGARRGAGAGGARGRIRRAVRPTLVILGLLSVGWLLTRFSHNGSGTTQIVVPASTVPARATDHPPPSNEEAARPLGVPAATPAGPGKYEVIRTQPDAPNTPVAYDPCRPIHYVINPARAPRDAAALVQAAFARLQTATGLHFVDDGATSEPPRKARPLYQPGRYNTTRWAPVLIAWSNENAYPDLAGYVAGESGSAPVYAKANRLVYVTGQVVLDYQDLSIAKVPDRSEARAVIMHELGHLVGLDHTSDRSQLMFSEAEFNVRTYGAGDLRGLALLGTQACYPGV
jgi:hypothetical protein